MNEKPTITMHGCTFLPHYCTSQQAPFETRIDYCLMLSCAPDADVKAAEKWAKTLIGLTSLELAKRLARKFRPSFQKATLHSGGTFYVVAQDAEDKEQVRYLLLCTPQGPIWMPIEQTKPIPWD